MAHEMRQHTTVSVGCQTLSCCSSTCSWKPRAMFWVLEDALSTVLRYEAMKWGQDCQGVTTHTAKGLFPRNPRYPPGSALLLHLSPDCEQWAKSSAGSGGGGCQRRGPASPHCSVCPSSIHPSSPPRCLAREGGNPVSR